MLISTNDTKSILDHMSRAWFPEPEFRVSISHDLSTFSTRIHILHRAAARSVAQLFDVSLINDAADVRGLLEHTMESMAYTIHSDVAMRGFGTPYKLWPGGPLDWYVKEALFDLMGLKILSRECQGSIGEDGAVMYLVKQDQWVRRISKGMLYQPFEWWSDFVRGLISAHAEKPK